MLTDLQTIFAKREELMRDKWNDNRSAKTVCRSSTSKTSFNSKTSVFVDDENVVSNCLLAESLALQKYGNGETIFHVLAREGRAQRIKELMSKYASMEKDDYGLYPWHVAVLNGHVNVVEQFIEQGSQDILEPSEHYQFSLLHLATVGVGTTEKQGEMIKYLLQRLPKINIDAVDMYGRTALFCAGQYKKPILGELLLTLGADPEILTDFNYCVMSMSLQTCPDLALKLLDWYVVNILIVMAICRVGIVDRLD